jgi:hypothetical protein
MPTDPNLTRNWLKMVGAFNDAAMAPEEFEMRLAVLAPALAAEFAPEVFTPDTARTVARRTLHFPVFGEICELLTPMVREQRERQRLLALPPPRAESRKPYVLPMPPPEKPPRSRISIRERDDMTGRSYIPEPIRTVEEQLKELGFSKPPMRAAALSVVAEVKRGEPTEDDVRNPTT